MPATDLKQRTKKFALEVIAFVEALPKDETSRILGRQLLRSGTSVGANYRSAKRARSNADFISRMGIVEEEADECGYWVELLTESGKVHAKKSTALHQEAGELVAIAVASINTARGGTRKAEGGKNQAASRSFTDRRSRCFSLSTFKRPPGPRLRFFFPRSAFR